MKINHDKPNILNEKKSNRPIDKSPISGESGGDWKDDESIIKPRKTYLIAEDIPDEENEDSIIEKIDRPLQDEEIPEDEPEPILDELSDIPHHNFNDEYESKIVELNPGHKGKMITAHAGPDEVAVTREKENLAKMYEKIEKEFGTFQPKTRPVEKENSKLSSIYKHFTSSSKRKGTTGSKKGNHTVTSIAHKDNLKTTPDKKVQRTLRGKIRDFLNKPL